MHPRKSFSAKHSLNAGLWKKVLPSWHLVCLHTLARSLTASTSRTKNDLVPSFFSPLTDRGKTLFIKVFNSSGPKQSGLWQGLLHHLFLPRHLGCSHSVADSQGCSPSSSSAATSSGQEELCKVCELKDSCSALDCAMLGAYLSLDGCILILSLLFWSPASSGNWMHFVRPGFDRL